MKNHIKPHSISIKNTFSAFYPPQNCHKRKPNREVGAGVREGIRPTAIDTKSIACSPTKGGAQQSCGVRSTRSNRKRKPNREVGTGVREGIRTPDLRFRNSFYPVKRHQKRSFLHILFANFCILPAFYILFYSNASNFYYRNYFFCLKLCQNYALWEIRVGVIRLCKCRAFKLCNYHELRENTDSIHGYQERSEFF